MFGSLFKNRFRRHRERVEIDTLIFRYGERAADIVLSRADDDRLPVRDRKHWRRVARKIARELTRNPRYAGART